MLEEDIVEVFKKLPKESFELLLRNISIREHMERLWSKYSISGRIKKDEEFERVFDEIFRFFFRPLEMFLMGEQYLRYFLPGPETLKLVESQREVYEAYEDFVLSLISHMKLTSELFAGYTISETARSLTESFVNRWWDLAKRRYKLELDGYRVLNEYPFILSKETSNDLFEAAEHWETFRESFFAYRDLMRSAYDESVDEFIEYANSNRIESFDQFMNDFAEIVARKFDVLIKSEEYLKIQRRMLGSLMDYSYHMRRFFESILEQSPLNPFATVSEMDEAYKRIMDLKRKVRELERRIEELEGRLGGGGSE
ncbi:MAG: hypothetical protein GXO67_05145 [Archaeoglobi archaeon]|nr:hypothetical protein [Archaeoglobi archaeon]